MELHHKLRRDPSWHPNSCNICGQLGHQAANCSTGTVNWRTIYSAEKFLAMPTVFQSELEEIQRRRKPDVKKLKDDVENYVNGKRGEDVVGHMRRRRNGLGQMPLGGGVPLSAMAPQAAAAPPAAVAPQAAATTTPAAPHAAAVAEKSEGDLPEGWATAKDSNGRIYYWHRETKKVQWQKPEH